MYPVSKLMGLVPLFHTSAIQHSYEFPFCTTEAITDDDGPFGHVTGHRAVLHGQQLRQVGPSYTKSHFVHSLRMLIFFFGVRPFANFSSSFTV